MERSEDCGRGKERRRSSVGGVGARERKITAFLGFRPRINELIKDMNGKLGPIELTLCMASYLRAVARRNKVDDSLEDWVSNRFGRRLFELFFKSYTEKVWGVSTSEIDEERFSSHLYTAGQPDPDLIIRTGGEQRTSNFLVWQGVYAELVFSETLWPDFAEADLDAAIEEFARRQRRYGA